MTAPAPEPLAIPPNYIPECSKTHTKMFPALLALQAQLDPIKKASENDHLKSTYADLVAVWNAIRSPLQALGLLVLQEPHPHPRGAMVTTTLVHVESGEWRRSTLFIPARKADAQAFGSALTYCRRYSLMTVLGLNTTDDDGHAASLEPPPAARLPGPPEKHAATVAKDEAAQKGWEAWGQRQALQLQGCNDEGQLIAAWTGMQPELKGAPDFVRGMLLGVKDQEKTRWLAASGAGNLPNGVAGDDVPF